MRIKLMILLLTIAFIFAGTRVYDIEPYKNVNAWSPYMGFIGQTFVATCDSFVWAEIFIGARCRHPEGWYYAEISEYPIGDWVVRGRNIATAKYEYARIIFTERNLNVKVKKGRTYFLKITHSNGDSINFYYDPNENIDLKVLKIKI
ncbi:MAG: hypothetical protein RMJ34_07075 [candidate division WOR-3 bacterium]|nr:hypothetical protein [candidate division WOR-3 bacterium]